MKHDAKTLIVAPYVGEFGWELMNWQGRVRWLIQNSDYQRVVLCTTADRVGLYKQTRTNSRVEYCIIKPVILPGNANEDRRVADDSGNVPGVDLMAGLEKCLAPIHERLLDQTVDVLMPPFDGSLWPTTVQFQSFDELRVGRDLDIDVVLVPRRRELATERNLPPSWWEELAARLQKSGLRVANYGSTFETAIEQLSSARLAIGASTGGLHLASLCRCPHLIWGSGSEARWTRLGMTNRQRYETFWNPFGTACIYEECGWQPSVERIASSTLRALDSIGLNEKCAANTGNANLTWRLKRAVAGLVQRNSEQLLIPWRLRQLIMERIL